MKIKSVRDSELLASSLFPIHYSLGAMPRGGPEWTRTTDLTIISRVL